MVPWSNEDIVNVSPSASVSLARTSITTEPPLATSPVSAAATGAALTGAAAMVTVTLTVEVPSFPSLIV